MRGLTSGRWPVALFMGLLAAACSLLVTAPPVRSRSSRAERVLSSCLCTAAHPRQVTCCSTSRLPPVGPDSHNLAFVQVAAGFDAGMEVTAGLGRTLSAIHAAATTSAKRALQPGKVSVGRACDALRDDKTEPCEIVHGFPP